MPRECAYYTITKDLNNSLEALYLFMIIYVFCLHPFCGTLSIHKAGAEMQSVFDKCSDMFTALVRATRFARAAMKTASVNAAAFLGQGALLQTACLSYTAVAVALPRQYFLPV